MMLYAETSSLDQFNKYMQAASTSSLDQTTSSTSHGTKTETLDAKGGIFYKWNEQETHGGLHTPTRQSKDEQMYNSHRHHD